MFGSCVFFQCACYHSLKDGSLNSWRRETPTSPIFPRIAALHLTRAIFTFMPGSSALQFCRHLPRLPPYTASVCPTVACSAGSGWSVRQSAAFRILEQRTRCAQRTRQLGTDAEQFTAWVFRRNLQGPFFQTKLESCNVTLARPEFLVVTLHRCS